MLKKLLLTSSLLFLVACTASQQQTKTGTSNGGYVSNEDNSSDFVQGANINYKVSKKYKSAARNERVRFIILHYTALNDEASIKALTGNKVSAHYLVTKKDKDDIYSLVPDTGRAWHAGVSSFDGYKNLNDNSIGIEIANLGYTGAPANKIKEFSEGKIDPNIFEKFTDDQVYRIAMLVKGLAKRYDVKPKYILGHSDIAPTRKFDPGPKFPWKRLYKEYGIGAWYDDYDYKSFYSAEQFNCASIMSIKQEFKKYGYDMPMTNTWDLNSKKVVAAFQMHFRPSRVDGNVDLETYAIIKALNKKYS